MSKTPAGTNPKSTKPPKAQGGAKSSGRGVFRPYFTHPVSGNTFYASDYGHKAWPIG